MEANLKKEKIRRDYVRRSIDQYFESLEKLLGSSNADPDELDECFIILENNVEQLDAINDRIQQLLPPSKVEFETDLKDNEKYRNRWLIMKKKYQNFKEGKSKPAPPRKNLTTQKSISSDFSEDSSFQKSEKLYRAALGSMSSIGMVYDARTDTYFQKSLFLKPLPDNFFKIEDESALKIVTCSEDQTSDRFDLFNIDPEQRLSIMLSSSNCRGYGQYFKEEINYKNTITYTLLHHIFTKHEELITNFDKLKTYIDKSVLNDARYTHVVVDVTWGMNSIFTLGYENSDLTKKEEIVNSLEAEMENLCFLLQLESDIYRSKDHGDNDFRKNLIIKIYSDASNYQKTTYDYQGLINFISKFHKDVKRQNNGNGVPLSYVLIAIADIKKYYGLSNSTIFKPIDKNFITSTITLLEDVAAIKNTTSVLKADYCKHEKYIFDDIRNQRNDIESEITKIETKLREDLIKNISQCKLGNLDIHTLNKITKKYKTTISQLAQKCDDIKITIEAWGPRLSIIEQFLERDIIYMGHRETLQDVVFQKAHLDSYVLHWPPDFCKENPEKSNEMLDLFVSMADDRKKNEQYVIVDHEINSSVPYEAELKIVHYKGRKIISNNVAEKKRSDLTPKFQSSSQRDTSEKETHQEELNILILGQSGVGKSTWINSLVNYLEYGTLTEAESKGVKHVIPVSFNVSYLDGNKNATVAVKVGENDQNENTAVGKSATKSPKTYTFTQNNHIIRLIDTPGLGDTDGIEQDRENMKKILDHISVYNNIHGISILLKSNETRIGAIFRYCIMELLTHLHRSAAKNILFCFTNSRSAFYTAGDTSPVLSNLLEELKLTDMIQLKPNTMFYLENEPFRYLCTLQYPQIPTSEDKKKVFESSWKKSVTETRRFFQRIKELEPHSVADTTTLCNARNRILNLTKPIMDIAQTIAVNLEALKKEQEKIKDSKDDVKKLKEQLKMPRIILEVENLPYPRLVCTSAKCTKLYNLEQSGCKEIEYVQICHDMCYLPRFHSEIMPNEVLKQCYIFNYDLPDRNKCIECECLWNEHMHITYSQKRVEKYVTDPEIENKIKDTKTAKSEIEKHKLQLENEIEMYKEEQKILITTSLKFGMFLKNNAIAPYNDSFEKYLMYLIEKQKTKADRSSADDNLQKNLELMLERYKEELKILENSMNNSDTTENITPQDILTLENDLFELKLTGEQIKNTAYIALKSNNLAQIKAEQVLPINPTIRLI